MRDENMWNQYYVFKIKLGRHNKEWWHWQASLQPNSSKVRLKLTHFSGRGVKPRRGRRLNESHTSCQNINFHYDSLCKGGYAPKINYHTRHVKRLLFAKGRMKLLIIHSLDAWKARHFGTEWNLGWSYAKRWASLSGCWRSSTENS